MLNQLFKIKKSKFIKHNLKHNLIQNFKSLYFITSLLLVLSLVLSNSCSNKTTNKKQKIRPDSASRDMSAEEFTLYLFDDATRERLFDSAKYEAVFYIENGKMMLDLTSQIVVDFGVISADIISPEDIKIKQKFKNLDKYNSEEIEFEGFSNIFFSFDRENEKQVGILSKTIEINNDFELYDHAQSHLSKKMSDANKENDSTFLNLNKMYSNLNEIMPLCLDYSELEITYNIGEKSFTKTVIPKYKIKPIQSKLNNFLLTPILYIDKDENLQFEVNATKKSENFEVYFATSEKVFINIYEGGYSKNKEENNLIFASDNKMNFLMVVDDNLPLAKGNSENYTYKLDKQKIANTIMKNNICSFEVGLRLSPIEDKCIFTLNILK